MPEYEALVVSFADKASVLLPVKNYAEFSQLAAAELGRIEIRFGGSALCLDERALHVSIAGLVSASTPPMELSSTVMAASIDSRGSASKVLAARKNRQKGGRPRKAVTAG